MNAIKILSAIILLGAVFVVLDTAQAATPGTGSCSVALADVGTGTYTASVNVTRTNTASFLVPLDCAGAPLFTVPAGESYHLRCRTASTGVIAPPGDLHIKVLLDDVSFGVESPGANGRIFSATTIPVSSCTTTNNVGEVFCTDDGTETGSPRSGVHRIHVRIARSTAPTWVGWSEDPNESRSVYGAVLCSPRVLSASVTDAGGGSSWVAGDSYAASVTMSGATYDGGAAWRAIAVCGSGSTTVADWGAASLSQSVTVEGPLTQWPDDCPLSFRIDSIRSTAIPGLSWGYANLSATAGAAVGSLDVAQSRLTLDLSATLDRTLTPSACTTASANRGQSPGLSCDWADARGQDVPSGRPGRLWLDATPLGESTVHATASDAAWGGTGTLAGTWTLKTDAPPGLVGVTVHEYATASRLSTGLRGLGHVPDLLTASDRYEWDSVRLARFSGGVNVSAGFTIGNDEQYAQPRGLRDINGVLVSGATTTCERYRPDGALDNTVNHGTTDASGHADEVQYDIIAPPGDWRFDCATTHNGNSGEYSVVFRAISTLTSDVNGHLHVERDGDVLNVSLLMRKRDADDGIVPVLPDAGTGVRFTLDAHSDVGPYHLDTRDVVTPDQECAGCASWTYRFDVASYGLPHGPYAITANLSIDGKPFVETVLWNDSASWSYSDRWSTDPFFEMRGERLPSGFGGKDDAGRPFSRWDDGRSVLRTTAQRDNEAYIQRYQVQSIDSSDRYTFSATKGSMATMARNLPDDDINSAKALLGFDSDYRLAFNGGYSGTNNYLQVVMDGQTRLAYEVGDIFQDGEWHHAGVTFDAGTIRLYLDGVNVANGTGPGSITVDNDKFHYYTRAGDYMQSWYVNETTPPSVMAAFYEKGYQASLISEPTATGGGVGVLASEITVTTALDVWIPLLIWGGLWVWLTYLRVDGPAYVAMINAAATLFEPDIWPMSMSVMLFIIALMVQSWASRSGRSVFGVFGRRPTKEDE